MADYQDDPMNDFDEDDDYGQPREPQNDAGRSKGATAREDDEEQEEEYPERDGDEDEDDEDDDEDDEEEEDVGPKGKKRRKVCICGSKRPNKTIYIRSAATSQTIRRQSFPRCRS